MYPLGDSGIVLHFSDVFDAPTQQAIRACCACLDQLNVPGLLEYVPAYTTLTIYYNPWLISQEGRCDPYERMTEIMEQMLAQAQTPAAESAPTVVEIPVCYGGQFGPDLEEVARNAGLSAADVIRLHGHGEYVVAMVGFAPGFPYLAGLNEQLAAPRKAQPRPRVPAGSVGIAGRQTGIYSISSPGGWQLIGRTPRRIFRPEHTIPSLLRAGDQVRFVSVSAAEFEQQNEHES
ncbi:Allophanate hydrolase subunit 1 [Hymenobacter roseosalivarius DSM 11622]|uniref:Allophanate hydrolase subunit 1 n=2 Tax=Hymenobacter roseosalivarius TaxID=89967 RepID=A0A1W1VY13_9BACT|nr:Allophanate hydrolase subunit 1 [Hymenobacter roseosalivarius DSM 11622]